MAKIAVIGGGISGLATAYSIEERASQVGVEADVVVFERDRRLGGKIDSRLIDGFLCESGPQGFIDNKPQPIDFCRRLELESELVIADDSASKRFVFLDGRLQMVPLSPPAMIKTKMISLPGKLRALMEFRTKPAPKEKDESIAEFARRHLGKEIVDKLISAMVVGIYAGDAEKLSVKSCFPVMLELEKEGDGSLLKAQIRRLKAKKAKAKAEGVKVGGSAKMEGMTGPSGKLTTFNEGMAQIIDRLKARIKGDVLTGVAVTGLSVEDGGYSITAGNGEAVRFDAVVLAVPAFAAAEILRATDDGLADLLDGIAYVPVNVAVCGYDKAKLGRDLDGFGLLVPKRERRRILGSLWVSSFFKKQAPENKVMLRTMLGGALDPDVVKLDDEATIKLINKEHHRVMGISTEPEFVRIFRHKQAIPQYVVGHSERLDKISEFVAGHPGLFLTGNAFKGIGFNDCLINAEPVAEQVLAYIKEVAPGEN